jgi:hypothetical protein
MDGFPEHEHDDATQGDDVEYLVMREVGLKHGDIKAAED